MTDKPELITVQSLSEIPKDRRFTMLDNDAWEKLSPQPKFAYRYFQKYPLPGKNLYFVEKDK